MENRTVTDYCEIGKLLQGCSSYLLVCSKSYDRLKVKNYLEGLDIPCVRFSSFKPNPDYADAIAGVEVFNRSGCDAIVAVGGGSAIDTAKCIKALCRSNPSRDVFETEYPDTGIPLIAIPTTAGTGSESTRFAVVYFKGLKNSVTADSLLPDLAVLDGELLESLPLYQKKCTVLDALCQAIESYWSVSSTEKSKEFSAQAIKKILRFLPSYLKDNDAVSREEIMLASNLAGKAINITTTTAAHAMSYKITSECGFPHGHAVAVCLPVLWEFMIKNPHKCHDGRGAEYVQKAFDEIGVIMGAEDAMGGVEVFNRLMADMEMLSPEISDPVLEDMVNNVNPVRLKNNPIKPDVEDIRNMYLKIRK